MADDNDGPSGLRIQFLQPEPDGQPNDLEFVGGPWAGRRQTQESSQTDLTLPDGKYVRSVRCADDGAIRIVWRTAGAVSGSATGRPA